MQFYKCAFPSPNPNQPSPPRLTKPIWLYIYSYIVYFVYIVYQYNAAPSLANHCNGSSCCCLLNLANKTEILANSKIRRGEKGKARRGSGKWLLTLTVKTAGSSGSWAKTNCNNTLLTFFSLFCKGKTLINHTKW